MTNDRLVYSTDFGSVCLECQKPKTTCACSELAKKKILGNGNVKIKKETKGRGGKTVTIISGLALNQEQLKALLKDLKKLSGSGGTLKAGVIEIQGDQVDKLNNYLKIKGYKVQ
jgi:translation initiation factor 1